MEETVFVTKSAAETEDLGEKLAHNFSFGDVILLHGDLGAGKTTFVQGVARFFKVKARVVSPTFILIKEYKGEINSGEISIYHIDLYRLEEINELKELGLDEIFEDKNGFFLIEWGKKLGNLSQSWEIEFEETKKNERRIKLRKNE